MDVSTLNCDGRIVLHNSKSIYPSPCQGITIKESLTLILSWDSQVKGTFKVPSTSVY